MLRLPGQTLEMSEALCPEEVYVCLHAVLQCQRSVSSLLVQVVLLGAPTCSEHFGHSLSNMSTFGHAKGRQTSEGKLHQHSAKSEVWKSECGFGADTVCYLEQDHFKMMTLR